MKPKKQKAVTVMNGLTVFNRYLDLTVLSKYLLVLLIGLPIYLLYGCGDDVELSNTSGSERGVLIDGQDSTGQLNDKTFISNTDIVDVGNVEPSAVYNEVIAFTNLRPLAINTSTPWTTGSDDIPLPFANEIQVPVTIWIVRGPFMQQRTRAINAVTTTVGIWDDERMGVTPSPVQIVDATGDPDAPSYFAFNCSMQNGIENDIGKTNGRINVYYVDTVDGGTGRGQACSIGSDFAAMGRSTGNELLSHEFGHDFALTHIDDLTTDFNQTNVMHSASNTRQFLTEGQLQRSHMKPNSALNSIYNARPGEPNRNCPRNTASDECIDIRKRIWADGTFPAN